MAKSRRQACGVRVAPSRPPANERNPNAARSLRRSRYASRKRKHERPAPAVSSSATDARRFTTPPKAAACNGARGPPAGVPRTPPKRKPGASGEHLDSSSGLWNPEHSLDRKGAVAALRRGRVGGEARVAPPTPAEEELRAAAMQRLRDAFTLLCRQHGLHKTPTGSLEKWHFQWLHHAGQQAIAAGRTAPPEPLLPQLASDDLDQLESMLWEDLVGKGLPAAAATSVAAGLRQATAVAANELCELIRKQHAQPQHDVEVAEPANGTGRTLVVRHGSRALRVNRTHYEKLRGLFTGDGGDEQSFRRAVFCLLLRYKALLGKGLGGGFQAALGGEVFAALRKSFNARFEGFASPLNCRYHSFCSAFPDTDEAFGSLGSFFALAPVSGSFQLNPPFVYALILAMASRLEELLAAAEAQGGALTFVIAVGANGASHQRKVWQRLQGSRFHRAQLSVKFRDHGYYDGAQHISREGARLSTCDTGVFVWQTARASEASPASDAAMRHVAEGFRATRPQPVKGPLRRKRKRAREPAGTMERAPDTESAS